MNKLVTYLQSKEAVFHGAMALMLMYVPHAASLFMELEHLDMTLYGFTVLNWVYGLVLASVIEFLILILIVNGYRNAGKFYAVVGFFLNAFYYDYWYIAIHDPTPANIKIAAISLFVCLAHSLAVWQLSEIFYRRLTTEKVDLYCAECDAGPFPNKRSLEGHISKAHKTKTK